MGYRMRLDFVALMRAGDISQRAQHHNEQPNRTTRSFASGKIRGYL